MSRLVLSAALLVAMASAAAAQSNSSRPSAAQPASGASTVQPPATGLGVDNGLNAPTLTTTGIAPSGPRTGGASPCTADTSCGSFPLTPLGSATITRADQPTAGAASSASGGSFNQSGSTLASPGVGGSLTQTGGALATQTIGGPAISGSSSARTTPAPSMPSNSFAAQCANSLSCSAFLGQ